MTNEDVTADKTEKQKAEEALMKAYVKGKEAEAAKLQKIDNPSYFGTAKSDISKGIRWLLEGTY